MFSNDGEVVQMDYTKYLVISALSTGPLTWCFWGLLVVGASISASGLVSYTVLLSPRTLLALLQGPSAVSRLLASCLLLPALVCIPIVGTDSTPLPRSIERVRL